MDRGYKVLLAGILLVAGGCVWLSGCTDDNGAAHDCFVASTYERAVYTRDYNYAAYRYFDLGLIRDPDADTLIRFLYPTDTIVRFELFEGRSGPYTQTGTAYPYWLDTSRTDLNATKVTGEFQLLNPGDVYNYASNDQGWYLYFQHHMPAAENRAYACYLEVRRNGQTLQFGQIARFPFSLLLIKGLNPAPSDPLWDAEWKNVYDLGIRFVDYDAFGLDIYRGAAGTEDDEANPDHQNSVPYLQLLGLDRTDQSGNEGMPDLKIDNNPAVLDLERGLLIFPDRRPFDSDVGYAVNDPDSVLNDRVPEIYDAPSRAERMDATQYYVKITTYSRSTAVSLGRTSLIPESEEITLNGRRLERHVDYDINYVLGWVSFYNDAIRDPNAEVQICYEYCP